MTFTTRFAPSPTGPLHLGHAYSALLAFESARAAKGNFLLRIEDIDQSRARTSWEAQIYDDLTWLGLVWPTPVMRQSERHASYARALDRLWEMGLLYPCRCSRRDIKEASLAPQEGAPLMGPDGLIYPGTCRPEGTASGPRPNGTTLRLNMKAACAMHPELDFTETGFGPNGETGQQILQCDELLLSVGDVVLARPDMGTSYHLSVVIDDAAQNITHVIRGQDLFEATAIHVLLQRLMGVPTPIYHHHALIRDAAGKRLAKRDDARAIAKYRAEGESPAQIRSRIALPA